MGNSAGNILSGAAGNDILAGGAGDDTLTGGAGRDTFQGTAAELNGDTITDFSPGDTIFITDGSLLNFDLSATGNTLSFAFTGGSGSITLTSVPTAGLIRRVPASGTGIELYVPVPQAGTAPHAADLNGDGNDDIMWRNDAGAVVTFHGQLNGSFVGNVIEGTGDFNGDGYDDILWRNDAGIVVDLLGQDNGSFVGNVNFTLNPGLDWHIVGTGDFNGDGYDDILWRNDSGTITDLLGQSNGAFVGNVANLNINPGTDWHAQPTLDNLA